MTEPKTDEQRATFMLNAVQSSIALWGRSAPRLTSGWRAATYGDPGFRSEAPTLVGFGYAKNVDFARSQLVLVKPRWAVLRMKTPQILGNGVQTNARAGMAQEWVQIHAGIYDGTETEAPMIAAEVLAMHAHEEQVEPLKRIDAIYLQMPDGAYRAFRRDGTVLRELKVKQQAGNIVRGLSPGRAE